MFKLMLSVINDIIFLVDVLLCLDFIHKSPKKRPSLISVGCFLAVFVSSVLFYSSYFDFYNPVLNAACFALFYFRFPFAAFLIKGLSFGRSIYITLILSQLFSLTKSLIYNISDALFIAGEVSQNYISLGIRLTALALLIFLNRSGDLKAVKRVLALIPRKIYILVAVNLLLLSSLTSVTGYSLTSASNISRRVVLINLLLLLIFFLSAVITVSLISICISKIYYNNISSILEKQIKSQLEHYERTEILNNDLRRFRHDYTNHMLCLKSMINGKQYDEALEYIEGINSEVASSGKNFNTGHRIADAILNEKAGICPDISFNFEGRIPDFYNNVDLCIIFGNAVDNAVEACERLGSGRRTIHISADVQQGIFILIFRNPTSEDLVIDNIFPETTKDNSLQHGFGLSNIKRIVDKYEGDMSVSARDGVFTLYIALKNNKA